MNRAAQLAAMTIAFEQRTPPDLQLLNSDGRCIFPHTTVEGFVVGVYSAFIALRGLDMGLLATIDQPAVGGVSDTPLGPIGMLKFQDWELDEPGILGARYQDLVDAMKLRIAMDEAEKA